MIENQSRIRTAILAGAMGLATVVLIASGTISTTAAGYRDNTHARTASVSVEQQVTPFRPGISRNARMVDTGLGLGNDGNVYVWGRTNMGMSGGGSSAGGTDQAPTKVPLPEGTIRQVTGQIYDINALDENGNVWGWGYVNSRNGTDAPRPDGFTAGYGTPQRLRIGTAWNGNGELLSGIVTISSTEYAGAGIDQDGAVWHWGDPTGYGGNSGVGASKLAGLPDPSIPGNRPVYLKGAYTNFFLILENGEVWYWGGSMGNSLPGTLGNVGASPNLVTPLNSWMKKNVSGSQPYIVAVDGGINMGGAILSDGTVLSWGSDLSRTGRTSGSATSPGFVTALPEVQSMQFAFTGVIFGAGDGSLWGYGASDDISYGGLSTTPAKIDDDVAQYASGQGYYIWQRTDGTFWGQGYNIQGAIGLPSGRARRQITNPDLSMVTQ